MELIAIGGHHQGVAGRDTMGKDQQTHSINRLGGERIVNRHRVHDNNAFVP